MSCGKEGALACQMRVLVNVCRVCQIRERVTVCRVSRARIHPHPHPHTPGDLGDGEGVTEIAGFRGSGLGFRVLGQTWVIVRVS